MKKIILTTALLLITLVLNAQTVNVHFKDGTKVQFPSNNVDHVDFSLKPDDPILTPGKVVDLGLSVYWGSCNLGAESPEESGNFYSWGETSPKSSYGKENYAYYDKSTTQYVNIGSNISGTQYDAAKVNLGGSWRMPTEEEFQELKSTCTWKWTQVNNINGYKITAANGNSIFLPAAGCYWDGSTKIDENEECRYWTSTAHKNEEYSYALLMSPANLFSDIMGSERYNGLPIRPVTSDLNDSGEEIDHSQDHLVTDKISLVYTGGSTVVINGMYQSGSQFNFTFKNNSSSAVTLTSIYMKDASDTNKGNNTLDSNTEVKAGESTSYTITIGKRMMEPQAVFTYIYNKKTYSVNAKVQ